MAIVQTIAPCLWLDGNAKEVVDFYPAIFPSAKEIDIAALQRAKAGG